MALRGSPCPGRRLCAGGLRPRRLAFPTQRVPPGGERRQVPTAVVEGKVIERVLIELWPVWRDGDRLGQRAVFDGVEVLRSDSRPAGRAEALGLEPEPNEVVGAPVLHAVQEVGHCHIVSEDLVHCLGHPRARLRGQIIHTGMPWNEQVHLV